MTDIPWPILMSYHYHRDCDIAYEVEECWAVKPRVFADSGAFSAYASGVEVDLHEYTDWCLRNADALEVTASLDVIGSAEASHENFEHLKQAGVDCIPVFHVGDPWELLDHYVATEPYIALGGMVGNSGANRFIDDCFERTEGTGVKFHGFGMTKMQQVYGYPWHSVDSSSWLGARFGDLYLFDDAAGRLRKTHVPSKELALNARLIEDHGGDPANLLSLTKKTVRAEMHRVTACAYQRFGCRAMSGDATLWLAGHDSGSLGKLIQDSTGRLTTIQDDTKINEVRSNRAFRRETT